MLQDEIEVLQVGRILSSYWHAFFVRGVILLGFGLFFLFFPATSWSTVSFVFGALSLTDATFNVIKAFVVARYTEVENKYKVMLMFVLGAVFSAVIGFVAIFDPAATAAALLLVQALWLVFVGIAKFWLAWLLAGEVDSQNSRCSGFVGLLYVVTGVTLMCDLGGNVGFFIRFVGLCVLIFGVQMIFVGRNLKRLYETGTYTSNGEVGTPLTYDRM
ncbi:protein of unknown function DUF308 containing protein [Nitzschia inconspicua]|uniref:Uncharacterized protein n=1 Tax=Nitzschia inconspicua TaxID=303405 RepID=A0A9K3PE72_9STRA|nr:protein of unknown function DUF308 containing protein [Nitzschia inconspicua]